MIASMVMAHLAAIGDLDRVAAFSLAVTVLDQDQAGLPSALLSHKAAAASTRASAEKGYLDGRVLAEVFAWLRPNDLIWNYWVNNYLLGHAPKAFDILYWNADPVRMTAGDAPRLHGPRDPQRPHRAGRADDARAPTVDLGKVDTDTYVVAGIADHLCKWESCYRTTQLFGGEDEVRALHQRPHRGDGEPAGEPQGQLPDRGGEPRRRRRSGWARRARSRAAGGTTTSSWLAERTGPERNKPQPARLGRLRAGLRRPGHLCP